MEPLFTLKRRPHYSPKLLFTLVAQMDEDAELLADIEEMETPPSSPPQPRGAGSVTNLLMLQLAGKIDNVANDTGESHSAREVEPEDQSTLASEQILAQHPFGDRGANTRKFEQTILSPLEPPPERGPDFVPPPRSIAWTAFPSISRRDDPRRFIGNHGEAVPANDCGFRCRATNEGNVKTHLLATSNPRPLIDLC